MCLVTKPFFISPGMLIDIMLAFGVWVGDSNSHAVIEGTVEAIYGELLDKIQSVAKCTTH